MIGGEAPVDFAIIGAQKGGTTHLNRCLGEHPDVFMPIDEVPFFEDPFFANSDPRELTATMAGASTEQIRGISRPEYLARPECPSRLVDAGVDRVIVVVRDPVDRALSAYCWYVQLDLLPLVPAADGLTRLLDGWSDPAYPRAAEILEMGRYATHLDRYREVYDPEAMLVLRSADVHDPVGLARTFSFLGVDPTIRPPSTARRSNEGVYDARRLRWLRLRSHLAFSWDSVDHYTHGSRRWRRPLAFIPTAAVVAVDRGLLSRVLGNDKPTLDDALVDRLREHYDAEVTALEQMYGWDLTAWHRP